MDLFKPPPADREVYVHPPNTIIPLPGSNAASLAEVPAGITDQASLWNWLLERYPSVSSVYREATRKWVAVNPVSAAPLPEPPFTLHVRTKLTAPLSPVSSTLVTICSDAIQQATSLISSCSHGQLTLASLSDPTRWNEIKFLDDSMGSIRVIGRQCTADAISFIRSTKPRQPLSLILGSAQSGKTFSVRAASLFLFVEFSTSDVQGRLMYVDGQAFVDDPALALIRSLALAYHDSAVAHNYIQNLKDDEDAGGVVKIIWKIVRADGRRLYLLLDGGPKLSNKNAALLRHINDCAAVVLCGKWDQWLDESRTMFINGGFSEEEITTYLKDQEVVKESILWKTGWVPGLVEAFLEAKAFDDFDLQYRTVVESFIDKLHLKDRLSDLLSGGCRGNAMRAARATGVFYLDDRCISDRLLSHACKYAAVAVEMVARAVARASKRANIIPEGSSKRVCK